MISADERVRNWAAAFKLPMGRGAEFFRAVLNSIANEAKAGRDVLIPGFGTFYRSTTKPRQIRNPATGKLMKLPASYRLGFRASKFQKGAP